MKLHLPGQRPVPLNRDMVTALFDMDRLDDPKTAAALVAQGLAERDPAGELLLTALGGEVREELTRLVPLGVDGSGHMRATLHPTLSEKRAEHLTTMLNRIAAGDTDDGWWARRHPVRATVLLILPPMFSGRIAEDIFGTWWAMFPVMFATMGGLCLALTTWKRAVAARGPVGVAQRFRERYVAPGMLNTRDRALLERAQHAVDTILSSDLHRDGLLLDPDRNQAALAAAEWAIAGTPADLARTEEQVLLLEEYAARVRAADDERTDITSARRLEEIAHRTTGSTITHTAHEEEPHFLAAAQETARRLAQRPRPHR